MKIHIIKLSLIFVLGLAAFSCSENKIEEKQIENHKIPVKILTVQTQAFYHYFEVKANVEAVEFAIISPETPGQIKKIFVNEGQKVAKGDLLLKQNSSVIEGKIRSIQTQLNLSEITYHKQKELWLEKQIGSEIQYLQTKTQYENLQEQLKTLQAQFDMSEIKAPFSGIVDQINLKEGELASPGMQVIALVNLNKIKFIADVSEIYLPVIHKGDSADITFSTYPNIKLRKTIFRTGNIINPTNRTFNIEIRSKNINNQLKPNMISTIKINDFTDYSALIVPSIIIKKDFEKQFIFIAEKTNNTTIARKVFVETGRSYKDKTIITKGISPYTKVIIDGYNIVSNGSEIDIKTNSTNKQPKK